MDLSHNLQRGKKSKSKAFKRFIDWINRHYFSCDIPCDTQIGKNVRFGHTGLGVVINVNSVIGDNVFIQHGVTLGLTKGEFNAPIIEKNVIIGARAILLGKIRIGEGSVIGAGAIVTKDIPSNSIVVGVNQVKPISEEMKKVLDKTMNNQ